MAVPDMTDQSSLAGLKPAMPVLVFTPAFSGGFFIWEGSMFRKTWASGARLWQQSVKALVVMVVTMIRLPMFPASSPPDRSGVALSRRGLMQGAVAAFTAVPFVACSRFEDVTKRIKIIAMAEVDGKRVEGSSVTEITWHPRGDGGMNSWQRGEAAVLELAGRGTVYILNAYIGSDTFVYSGLWRVQVELAAGKTGATTRQHLPAIEQLKGRFPVVPWKGGIVVPIIVAFKDETEFRSVYRVEPEKFSSYFGPGVKFIGVDFEITDDPLTDVLKKRLPILTRPVKGIPKELNYNADGKLKGELEIPFEYRVGPITFFSPGKY